MPCVHW